MALDPWSYAASTKSEHAEQVALFMWCNMAANFGLDAAEDPKSYSEKGYAVARWPFRGPNAVRELAWLYAIHNQGHGDVKRGMRAKAEGVKAGAPDMCLPVPCGYGEEGVAIKYGQSVYYHGLYIELKRTASVGKAEGTASDPQIKWQTHLVSVGYACEVAIGWIAARNVLLRYLGVTTT